ncbi:MAG: hypothetical protein JXX28_15105 [Deltaproteobacteria bacterium]|nr:hypothetical protein [Deltaproteobacteria bacterium]
MSRWTVWVLVSVGACGDRTSDDPCSPSGPDEQVCWDDTGLDSPPDGELLLTVSPTLDGVPLDPATVEDCRLTLSGWASGGETLSLACGATTTVASGSWTLSAGSGYHGGVPGLTELDGGVLVSPLLDLELWPARDVDVEVPLNRFVDDTFACTRTRWIDDAEAEDHRGALVDEVALGPWKLVVDSGQYLMAPDAPGWGTYEPERLWFEVAGSALARPTAASVGSLNASLITADAVSWELLAPGVSVTAMRCERVAD